MTARRASRPAPARPSRSAAAWLLALALVVAQALGLAHRIEHGEARGPAERHAHGHDHGSGLGRHGAEPASTVAVASALPAADASSGEPSSGDVGHDSAAFDHATVADAAPLPPSCAAAAVAHLRVHAPSRAPLLLAAQAAGYLARGPPAA